MVQLVGVIASYGCVLAFGWVLRRRLRERIAIETLLWAYLVMGIASTAPHHAYRMALNTAAFAGSEPVLFYLFDVVPSFVLMSLGWPVLQLLLLVFHPGGSPDVTGQVQREAVVAATAALFLAPVLTLGSRCLD